MFLEVGCCSQGGVFGNVGKGQIGLPALPSPLPRIVPLTPDQRKPIGMLFNQIRRKNSM